MLQNPKLILKIILPILILILDLSLTQPIFADVYFAQAGQIMVNKQTKDPKTGKVAKSLTFQPGNEVVFRIEVTNTGGIALKNIQVADKLPVNLNFVSGPGTFDQTNQTLNFNIDNLFVGETKPFEVKTTLKSAKDMVKTQEGCLTNTATARTGELFSTSSSQVCLNVLGVTQELPKTGPREVLWVVLASISLFLISAISFKKSFFERG